MTGKKQIWVKYMRCGCCGRDFKGWQHPEHDQGYGICGAVGCGDVSGYHSEIFEKEGTELLIDWEED